jgi:hypothetical protein
VGNVINGNKLLGGAVNGWTISGTTTFQSGGDLQTNDGQNFGLSITDTTNSNEGLSSKSYYGTNVGMILPVNTCNPKAGLGSHQEINMFCIAPPALGQHGKMEVGGYIGGPAYFNSDLTVYKEFKIVGKQNVQFRASMFNFLNHPLRAYNSSTQITPTFTTSDRVNFTSTLASNIKAANAGLVQGTPDQKVGYRLGELSVKYNF